MAELRRALEILQIDACDVPTSEQIRKQYLRLALKLHPDRNPGKPDAADQFRTLGDAYSLALRAVAAHDEAVEEAQRTQAMFNLFMRALKGEEVKEELEKLGVYRPSAQFGVDLGVRFDSRLPEDDNDGVELNGRHLDIATLFKQAFNEDGLNEVGDPVEGFALAPGEEMF